MVADLSAGLDRLPSAPQIIIMRERLGLISPAAILLRAGGIACISMMQASAARAGRQAEAPGRHCRRQHPSCSGD